MTREHRSKDRVVAAPLLLYGSAVFLSSAITLVLEITAGRLIAPYVGVSIYSWTSIIGVVLAGLSLGNWLGGTWADRGGADRGAGLVLVAAAISSLGVLTVLTIVAPMVMAAELSLLSGAFVLAASLFFVPSVLLGVITPLLTTLALQHGERPGRIVGSMHALAALGSITGTFAAGFWLIQHVGTRNILILCTVTLFLVSIPFLFRRAPVALVAGIALVLVTGGITEARRGFLNPCTVESQYYCIRVEPAFADVPFGEARAMVLDHLVHGVSHATEPGMLVSPYVHLTDELVSGYLGPEVAGARYFFAGGGAYTHPRAVKALTPEALVTVAEIDPAVTEAAVESLYLDHSGMRVLHTDARMALHRLAGERFDVVIGDVAHDVAMPWHLLTREYTALVRSRLAPDGLYVLNVIDGYPDPLLVKSIVKTLREQFRYVHVWLEELPSVPVRETYILSATDRFEPPRTVTAFRGFERTWIRITDHLESSGTALDTLPLLTDDFVPVERLVGRLIFTELGR